MVKMGGLGARWFGFLGTSKVSHHPWSKLRPMMDISEWISFCGGSFRLKGLIPAKGSWLRENRGGLGLTIFNTARRNGLLSAAMGFLTLWLVNLSTATIHDNRKGPVARKKNNHNKKRDEFPIHVILQISNGTYYFCWWPFPIAAPTSHALIPKPTTSIETRKSSHNGICKLTISTMKILSNVES